MMTSEEIREQSETVINHNNKTKGQYEGCARWVPYLHEFVLWGQGEPTIDPEVTEIDLEPSDRETFPELEDRAIKSALIWEHKGKVRARLRMWKEVTG